MSNTRDKSESFEQICGSTSISLCASGERATGLTFDLPRAVGDEDLDKLALFLEASVSSTRSKAELIPPALRDRIRDGALVVWESPGKHFDVAIKPLGGIVPEGGLIRLTWTFP